MWKLLVNNLAFEKYTTATKNSKMIDFFSFINFSLTERYKKKINNQRHCTSNLSKMRVRYKSQMFFIITPFMEELLKRIKMFEKIWNQINLLFLHLCVKLELEEPRCHKVLIVMSIEFDLPLLVSLQWLHNEMKCYHWVHKF